MLLTVLSLNFRTVSLIPTLQCTWKHGSVAFWLSKWKHDPTHPPSPLLNRRGRERDSPPWRIFWSLYMFVRVLRCDRKRERETREGAREILCKDWEQMYRREILLIKKGKYKYGREILLIKKGKYKYRREILLIKKGKFKSYYAPSRQLRTLVYLVVAFTSRYNPV